MYDTHVLHVLLMWSVCESPDEFKVTVTCEEERNVEPPLSVTASIVLLLAAELMLFEQQRGGARDSQNSDDPTDTRAALLLFRLRTTPVSPEPPSGFFSVLYERR